MHVDANLVNTIFQDQEGMIWLGTKRGLYSYNGYDLHEYIDEMYPNGNPVFSIVQTSADYLCLGTDNGVRWFNLTDRRIEHLSFDAGLSMAVRSLSLFGEYLWVGTRDNGLIRMSLSTGTVEAIGLHDKDETTIYSLEPTSDKLFIASYEHFSFYDQKDDVALYIYTYNKLPGNYITKKEAQKLGWEGGSLESYAPGKCIGGDRFGNYEGLLPEEEGRTYKECDIDTIGKKRGAKRIVFSNDGLIYYTDDHYESFDLLYGEE